MYHWHTSYPSLNFRQSKDLKILKGGGTKPNGPSLSHTNQWGSNISCQGSTPPPLSWSHSILRGIYRHTTSLHYRFYQSILIRSFFPRAVKRPQNQGPGVHKYHNEVYFWNFWPAQIWKRIFFRLDLWNCGAFDELVKDTYNCRVWIYLTDNITISSLFFGFGKEIISSFLLFFSSLRERCSLLLFILYSFRIQARGNPDPLKYFTKFYIP